MKLNVEGAMLDNNVVSAIKEIQECKSVHLEIIEKQMNLLISQRANIQESDGEIIQRLEDLNLLKKLFRKIGNGVNDERQKE